MKNYKICEIEILEISPESPYVKKVFNINSPQVQDLSLSDDETKVWVLLADETILEIPRHKCVLAWRFIKSLGEG